MSEHFSASPATMHPVVNTTMGVVQQELVLRDQLTPIVKGLLRMDKMSGALDAYCKVLIAEVKSLSNKVSSANF
jgi:hypothetical protein